MSIALIVLGFTLVLCGVFFAVRGFGTAQAGGSAVKSFSIQGPSWLILVAIGAGVIVFGAWLYKGSPANQVPPTTTSTTVPPTTSTEPTIEPYGYGDDPFLDLLYDECLAQDMQACDDLFQESPVGSDYELFGATCGFLIPEADGRFCIESDPTKLPHSD